MKFKIGTKIGLGYTVLIVLILALGVYCFTISNATNHYLNQIDLLNDRLELERDIQVYFNGAMAGLRGYYSTGSVEFKNEYTNNMNQIMQALDELMKITAAENKSTVENLQNMVDEYDRIAREDLISLVEQRIKADSEEKRAEIDVQLSSASSKQKVMADEIMATITELVNNNFAVREQYISEAKSNADGVQRNSVIFTALALLAGCILAFVLTNLIKVPILRLIDGANKFAEGDFSEQLQIRSNDEIGDLGRAFNNMAQRLSGLISNVAQNAQMLAAHSEQLAASAEEVNATGQEVASTANEVAAATAAGFENAKKAAAESHKAGQVAQAGNETVKRAVEKINAIAASTNEVANSIRGLYELSSQIGKITGVIAGIAEQTNLLALNAAIEAARAGEHGKGFAVVADEVRKLAEQSADATEEINQLIQKVQDGVEAASNVMQHGVKEVEEGVQLASEAGQALDNIITSVNSAISMIKEIAEISQQNSEGMEQLAASNEQISSTVQQVTAATQELAHIAGQLQQAVEQFKIAAAADEAYIEEINNTEDNTEETNADEDFKDSSEEEITKLDEK